MDVSNPFILAYLTEASLTPEELLKYYSFEPIQYLHQRLSSSNNIFLIGRPGIGKTMLLKIFDPELIALLYEGSDNERVQARKYLPKGTVGVYLNIASPYALLELFQGRDYESKWWFEAYADYLNSFLFELGLNSIEAMFQVEKWCKDNQVLDPRPLENKSVAQDLLSRLRRHSSDFDSMSTISEVREFFRSRVQSWTRFTNRDMGSKPPKAVFGQLGRPLFALVGAVRKAKLVGPAFRLFVIVDQYEALYDARAVIDYRPLFCEGMRAASRGSTGVEFKVGTRRYAYNNFSLPNGRGKIDLGREVVEIDLDAVADKFYQKLATDIFRKRLSPYVDARVPPDPHYYLPALTAAEEAELYTKGGSLENKHVGAFTDRWKSSYGFSSSQCDRIVRDSGLDVASALVGTLAAIGVTRWCRRGWRGAALKGLSINTSTDKVSAMVTQLKDLIEAIEHRLPGGSRKQENKRAKAVDNFVRDVTEPALFQLASRYKNQRRYYAGFESIVRLSSNVAIMLIELLQAVYEQAILSGCDVNVPVRTQIQSEAVYRVSSAWFRRIVREYDYGETHYEILSSLGAAFRRLQLELSAPQPCPNGFSVDSRDLEKAFQGLADPRSSARAWLEEAVSRGLLEEEQHQHKQRGKPKRTKYRINRIFCPYLGISSIWKKDPPYVRDLEKFVAVLRKGSVPEELAELLARSEATHDATAQQSLLP